MRSIIVEGVEHRLSDRNWKRLISRFDASKAKLNHFGYYAIRINSICVNRSYKCVKCPLRDPHKKVNSCTYLFEKIMGRELRQYLHLRDSGLYWEPQNDSSARQALQKILDVLNKAQQITSQKKQA